MKLKDIRIQVWFIAIVSGLFFAGCEEESNDYARAGEIFPRTDRGSAYVGESIVFTDYSTRVVERNWTFEGGTPGSSTEQQVSVLYPNAGVFSARLEVTFEDGSTVDELLEVAITTEYVPLVTLEGPRYVFYSEDQELAQEHPAFGLGSSGLAKVGFVSNAFEGEEAINISFDPDKSSTFIMLQTDKVGTADLTEFRDGYLNLAIKSTSVDPLHIRIEGGGANSYAYVAPGGYGFERDGNWHFISIPMDDVLAQIATEDGKMALLGSFDQFRLRNQTGELSSRETFDFTVDFIFFSVNRPVLN